MWLLQCSQPRGLERVVFRMFVAACRLHQPSIIWLHSGCWSASGCQVLLCVVHVWVPWGSMSWVACVVAGQGFDGWRLFLTCGLVCASNCVC